LRGKTIVIAMGKRWESKLRERRWPEGHAVHELSRDCLHSAAGVAHILERPHPTTVLSYSDFGTPCRARPELIIRPDWFALGSQWPTQVRVTELGSCERLPD
jgi:hypothetical protein